MRLWVAGIRIPLIRHAVHVKRSFGSAMTLGIVYLLTHIQLAARLVVSVTSLRQWYDGPITVFTTRPESFNVGHALSNDRSLDIEHRTVQERPGQGHVSSYITKTSFLFKSPYERTVFLDADTLVVGPLDDLLAAALTEPLVVTQFCNWTTLEPNQRKRIHMWRRLQGRLGDRFDLKRLIDLTLSKPFPAVNSGVFAVDITSPFLQAWDALTWYGRRCPCPDEVSLQLLLPTSGHCILGPQYNAHPNSIEPHPSVRIWHFAANSHLTYTSCRNLWWPAYEECYSNNVARIQTWSRVSGPFASYR
jgi:hypothetical protein